MKTKTNFKRSRKTTISKVKSSKKQRPAAQFDIKTMPHPPFIRTNYGRKCEIVALINAHIALYGKCPIKFNSEKFNNLYRKCGGTKRERPRDLEPALDNLGLELVDMPKFRSLRRQKAHFIKLLKANEIILYRQVYADKERYFTFLILDHFLWDDALYAESDPSVFDPIDGKDLFVTANGTKDASSWHDLTDQLLPPKSTAKDLRLLNTKEGYNPHVEFCINQTKIVRKAIINLKQKKDENKKQNNGKKKQIKHCSTLPE